MAAAARPRAGPARRAAGSRVAARMLERSVAGGCVADAHDRPPARGPGVQLVLEDDRGGLAVDPLALGAPLRGGWRAAGPAALHRPKALLGAMAAQALVAERDRPAGERRNVGGPGARRVDHRSLDARRLERQPDHQLQVVRAPAARRIAATSSDRVLPRGTVASGRARGPGSSAMADPMRRSPRSTPMTGSRSRSGPATGPRRWERDAPGAGCGESRRSRGRGAGRARDVAGPLVDRSRRRRRARPRRKS